MRRKVIFFRVVATLFAMQLSVACSPTGDFGRSNADPNTANAISAVSSDPRAEHFALTDEEREMNSRIHRFMSMTQTEPWMGRVFLASIGVVEGDLDHTAYYAWIKSEQFDSSRGPYNRLKHDIQVDLASLPQTFASICRVKEIDRRRNLALNRLLSVDPIALSSAQERLGENRARIAQFTAALGFRYDAYVYALERLLVETPHEQAREIDADLSELATANNAAFAGNFCAPPRRHTTSPSQSSLGAI